jgi:hypothetical protein
VRVEVDALKFAAGLATESETVDRARMMLRSIEKDG